MFASNGEMTPPCGVPASVSLTVPSSITPASNHCRNNFNTLRSETRSFTNSIIGLPLDVVKVALNVCVDHEVVSLVACYSDRFQGLGRASLRPESITARLEVRFENRLDYQLRRHLHHPISYRRYPQWPLLPICFRDVSPLHRGGTILACPQR